MADRTPPAPQALSGAARSELTRCARVVAQGPDPRRALFQLTATVARQTSADRCSILVPLATSALRILASSDEASADALLIALDRYPELRHVLATDEPLLIGDAAGSDLLRSVRDLVQRAGTVSVAAVPLRLSDTTGILRITSVTRRFGPPDLDLLLAAARLIEDSLDEAASAPPAADPWERLALALADTVVEVAADGRIAAVRSERDTPVGRGLSRLVGRFLGDVLHDASPIAIARLLRGASRPLLMTVEDDGADVVAAAIAALPCGAPPLRTLVAVKAAESPPTAAGSSPQQMLLAELDPLRRRVDRSADDRALAMSASAHELKTPLTVIQVYLETLLGDLSSGLSAEQLEFLRVCHDSALRLRRLVLDLVDLAAIDSGDIELQSEPVDLERVLAAVAADVAPLASHAGVRLAIDCPQGLPPALADGVRVEQVLQNLADNAVRHTPADGQVAVRCRADGGWLVVTVEDTGVGLAGGSGGDTSGEPSSSSAGPTTYGSGVGLAVGRRLVNAMGGRLTGASRSGGGSVFTMRLPRWEG